MAYRRVVRVDALEDFVPRADAFGVRDLASQNATAKCDFGRAMASRVATPAVFAVKKFGADR